MKYASGQRVRVKASGRTGVIDSGWLPPRQSLAIYWVRLDSGASVRCWEEWLEAAEEEEESHE